MTTANVFLAVVSKRMLTKREAAVYCGRSVREFVNECPAAPIGFPNGDELFDLHDLDNWLNGLKSRTDDTEKIIRRLGT